MIPIDALTFILLSLSIYGCLKRVQYLLFSSVHRLPSASGTDHEAKIASNEPGKQGWEWCKEKNSLIVTYKNSLFGKDIYVADVRAINFLLSGYRTVPSASSLRRRINILGHGLVTSQLDDHSRQRKILSQAFASSHLKTLVPIFNDVASKLVSRLQRDLDQQEGDVLELYQYASGATLDVIGKAGFDYDFGTLDLGHKEESTSTIAQSFRKAAKAGKLPDTGISKFLLSPAVLNIFPILADCPLFELNRTSKAARSETEAVGREIIDRKMKEIQSELSIKGKEFSDIERKDPTLAGKDLLHVLVRASLSNLPTSQRLSQQELIGQISTFLFAGSDTTSTAFSFSLHYLSVNPQAQSNLHKEIDEFYSSLEQVGGEVTWDNVNALSYLRAVILETLRLSPALPTIARVAREKLVVPLSQPLPGSFDSSNSFLVEKGAEIAISFCGANRDPHIWERPEEFYPERWLEGGLSDSYHQSAIPKSQGHMSFSTMEKNCIGWRFAQTEMAVLLVTFLKSFRVEPVSEITSILAMVARPVVLGEEHRGSQLPLRLIRRE